MSERIDKALQAASRRARSRSKPLSLRASNEEMFRQLREYTHEVFWIYDVRASRILYVSPAYESVWGRTPERLYAQPRSWLDAVHPEDRAKAGRMLEVEDRHEHLESEYRIVRPDGSVRAIRSRAFAVHDATGETYRVVSAAEDVTERKRLEQQLHAAPTSII